MKWIPIAQPMMLNPMTYRPLRHRLTKQTSALISACDEADIASLSLSENSGETTKEQLS